MYLWLKTDQLLVDSKSPTYLRFSPQKNHINKLAVRKYHLFYTIVGLNPVNEALT